MKIKEEKYYPGFLSLKLTGNIYFLVTELIRI
jgi:hypothetical protein